MADLNGRFITDVIADSADLFPVRLSSARQFLGIPHRDQTGQQQLITGLTSDSAASLLTQTPSPKQFLGIPHRNQAGPGLLIPNATPEDAEFSPAQVQPASQPYSKGIRSKRRAGKRKQRPHRRRLRRWFLCISIVMIIGGILLSQGNGEVGAWGADVLRAVLGPTITARIESWYLGVTDTAHQLQYHLNGQHVNPPWAVGTVTTLAARPSSSALAPMPLPRITPIIAPSITGEGAWIPQATSPPPYNYLPLVAKTFFRPDPARPYAIATLLQFDSRFILLHMVAGTAEPGGPRGAYGSGVIPAADQKGTRLLAAFNGGFKYADGQYGMKVNETLYVPPQPGAATIAVTKSGQFILGAWGVDPRLNSGNADLVAWRQNASLLIDHGVINPLTNDGAAWGGTILNSTYTWRSGIGITAHGSLIYAAGDSLSAQTLGDTLHAAGAVMAMQTDINPFWVRAFLYSHSSNGTLNIMKLNPAMQGTGYEYLNGTERDFFYLTRITPVFPPPTPSRSRESGSQ